MKSVSQIELTESHLLIFIPGRVRPRRYKWTKPLMYDDFEEIIKIDESLQPGYTQSYTKEIQEMELKEEELQEKEKELKEKEKGLKEKLDKVEEDWGGDKKFEKSDSTTDNISEEDEDTKEFNLEDLEVKREEKVEGKKVKKKTLVKSKRKQVNRS